MGSDRFNWSNPDDLEIHTDGGGEVPPTTPSKKLQLTGATIPVAAAPQGQAPPEKPPPRPLS